MGIGETLDSAIKIYRNNWKTLMAVVAIVVIPVELVHQLLWAGSVHTTSISGNTVYVARSDLNSARTLSVIFGLVNLVLVAPLLAGAMAKATADLYLGGVPDVGSVLSFAMSRLGAILLVTLLVGLSVVGGFILLIVPGIIIAIRLSAATVVVVVEDLRGRKAMGRSWRLVKGHSWRVFVTLFLAVLIAGVIAAILTIPFAFDALRPGLSGGILRFLGATLSAIITRPFVALVTTLLYFDLRIRKEGLDLAIMARDLGTSPRGA
jgi:hypothetical protein